MSRRSRPSSRCLPLGTKVQWHLWTLDDYLSAIPHPYRPNRSLMSFTFRFLRPSVGWDSHSPIQPVLHVIFFVTLRTPFRLILLYPWPFWVLGFMGESGNSSVEINRKWRGSQIWVLDTFLWRRVVHVVLGGTTMSRGPCLCFWLGATFTWRGDWNVGRFSISNSCGSWHRGVYCVFRVEGRMITTLTTVSRVERGC